MKELCKKLAVKTFELLLVPIVILIIGLYLQKGITERQEDLAVTQMVDNYFNGIAGHLNSENSESPFILARTRALIYRLHQLERKEEIVNTLRFISEVTPEILRGDVFEQDPQSDPYFVDLSNIDLSKSDIEVIEAYDMRAWNSMFNGSSFHNFSCIGCGFNHSSFRNARFSYTNLEYSDFTGANLFGSNIEEAFIEGAIFDDAVWSDGRKCAKGSIGQCN